VAVGESGGDAGRLADHAGTGLPALAKPVSKVPTLWPKTPKPKVPLTKALVRRILVSLAQRA
jgi:hypothetical protein